MKNEKWFNTLSGTQIEMLMKREEEQEQFKEEVRKDIHELIDICCDKCRLAGRNCLCVICMIKSIKKKYEGAEKCLNQEKSK